MFTDIIAQMVGDSDLATSVIPTKDYTLSAITVDAAAGILYGLGLMIVLPVIMMNSWNCDMGIKKKKIKQ